MQHALGTDSPQSKAGAQMTVAVVQAVQKLLSDAYNGRLDTMNRPKHNWSSNAMLQRLCFWPVLHAQLIAAPLDLS